jgi:hypothetical protein
MAELKRHVQRRGKQIFNKLEKKFGISSSQITRAIDGDLVTVRQIGELGKKGKDAEQLAPLVAQATIATIQGTVAIAEAERDIAIAAADGIHRINTAQVQTSQADRKLTNVTEELFLGHATTQRVEKQRHDREMTVVKLRAYIDGNFQQVDYAAKIGEQINRPALKQIEYARQRDMSDAKHWLSSGTPEKLELTPQKQYGSSGFFAGLNNLASALGLRIPGN